MTKNKLNIQTLSTKRTDKKADHILLYRQVTEKIKKAHPSHLLKFILASPYSTYLVLNDTLAHPSLNQNSTVFTNLLSTSNLQYGNK